MIDAMELAVIGGLVVVVLIMGPKKIPELAKAIGSAKRQYEEAKKN